jgi:uncharacterized protein YjiS (DUF1127 family)
MTAWPTISALPKSQTWSPTFTRKSNATKVLARARDVLSVCVRSQAASHQFEELNRLSDDALAARGLRRADLPRAAFRALTGE